MAARNTGKTPFLARGRVPQNNGPQTKPRRTSTLTNWRSLMSHAIRGHELHKKFLSQAMGFARRVVRGTQLDSHDLNRLEGELKSKKGSIDSQIARVLGQRGIKLRGRPEEKHAQMIDVLQEHSPSLLKELHTCFAIQHGLEKLRRKFK